MKVAAIRDRLEAQVPLLAGRTGSAAALAQLMRTGGAPEAPVFAHVVPEGIVGGKATSFSGIFAQETARRFAVILTLRSHDATGVRAMDSLEDLLDSVCAALAGWSPDPANTGALVLGGVRLVSAQGGTFVYEFTFTLSDQLRITT